MEKVTGLLIGDLPSIYPSLKGSFKYDVTCHKHTKLFCCLLTFYCGFGVTDGVPGDWAYQHHRSLNCSNIKHDSDKRRGDVSWKFVSTKHLTRCDVGSLLAVTLGDVAADTAGNISSKDVSEYFPYNTTQQTVTIFYLYWLHLHNTPDQRAFMMEIMHLSHLSLMISFISIYHHILISTDKKSFWQMI